MGAKQTRGFPRVVVRANKHYRANGRVTIYCRLDPSIGDAKSLEFPLIFEPSNNINNSNNSGLSMKLTHVSEYGNYADVEIDIPVDKFVEIKKDAIIGMITVRENPDITIE